MAKISESDERYISTLVEKGGPSPNEYGELNNFFKKLGIQVKTGKITRGEINSELWGLLGDACSQKTMQGIVARKPHGYAGDFETIDKIYMKWVSPEPHLKKWDYYFHSHSAAKAVRNRKRYFIDLIQKFRASLPKNLKVLSAGSGSARDVYELFSINAQNGISFECVDMDRNAVAFSKNLCKEHSQNINFSCSNIFRYMPNYLFGLIWSAGLFDYLDDKRFVFLLKRLYNMVGIGGQLVIGNFSEFNPSRDYMEAGDWFLHHRGKDKLMALAQRSGIHKSNVQIRSEPEKVNLFMHLHRR